jgi:hypothetical protein
VGYQEFKQEGINLSLGQDFTVNAKLSSADVQLNEVVVTSGAGQVISSDRTGASTNISNEQITKLPYPQPEFQRFYPFNSPGQQPELRRPERFLQQHYH